MKASVAGIRTSEPIRVLREDSSLQLDPFAEFESSALPAAGTFQDGIDPAAAVLWEGG